MCIAEGIFEMTYSNLPGTYSGTGNATKTVALNGDQAIDGLLTTVAWGGTSIDYSFPTSNSVYGYATQTDLPGGFFGLSLAQQQAAQFALDAELGVNALASAGFSAEGITNLGVNFDATPDKDQIRLANTTSANLADRPGRRLPRQLHHLPDRGQRRRLVRHRLSPGRSTTTPPRWPATTPGTPTSTRSATRSG